MAFSTIETSRAGKEEWEEVGEGRIKYPVGAILEDLIAFRERERGEEPQ
jgi:hypothetical protein